MPLWVDLSEHQVSLNVCNYPDGKRIILRKVGPLGHIPPEVTEIGFEPRNSDGDVFERRDLQFTLAQLRKYFPAAISREFSAAEVVLRPAADVVDPGAPADGSSKPRAPWHVPKDVFVAESVSTTNGAGDHVVVFDGIEYRPNLENGLTTQKVKEEVHARLVKDALNGRYHEPFSASPPTFEVMLAYSGVAYQLNQRAEKNVSQLLAQLNVAQRLMSDDEAYLRIENSPYIDLVVERLPGPVGDRLYFTHYLRIEGDTILDAEMVFDICKDGTLRLSETATQNPIRGGELRGRDVSFANIFSKNLLDQGFDKGVIRWPRDELAESRESDDAGIATVFVVGQRVRFERGLYAGSEGQVESVSENGRIVVRGDRGSGFGVTADEAAEWGLRILPGDESIDPTTPGGYALVMADEALQLKYQDALDAYLGERLIAVRNALHALGWKNGQPATILSKSFDGVNATASIDVRQVGVGRNVVKIIPKVYTLQSGKIHSIDDDLTKTPEDLAGQLDETALRANFKPVAQSSPEECYAAELSEYWVKLGKEPNSDLANIRAREFFAAISSRDKDDLIARLRPSTSPLSRTWFEKITGISLGRTYKETRIAIDAWAQQSEKDATSQPALDEQNSIVLPDYLRAVEASRAREVWERTCAEHEEPIKRVIDGFWQMARALWKAPEGTSDFPAHVQSAIHMLGDSLRFGQPATWGFDGALAHLFKVSDRLAKELDTADIEHDAGFPNSQRHSAASYSADSDKFDALRKKTVDGQLGGLIAFGDALITNIDASPMSGFARAYRDYIWRIEDQIERLKSLASEQERRRAAQADAKAQSEFGPYLAASLRLPTAVQLGLNNKVQTYPEEGMLRLFPNGWSNGHLLEMGRRPKLVTDAITKYFGDEHSENLRSVDAAAVDRIVRDAKAASTVKVEPIATYDSEFAVRGAITGSGLSMKREKDRVLPVNAIVMCNEAAGVATQVNKHYFQYFASMYKGCEFFSPPDGRGAILVKSADNVVGVIMSIRFQLEMKEVLDRAIRARAAAAEKATNPIPERTEPPKDRATTDAKVKVYGESDSPDDLRRASIFEKKLNDELVNFIETLPDDPAFRVTPLWDSVRMVARGEGLEARATDRIIDQFVSILPLEDGRFQARQGSAESPPTSLLTAVLWATNRIQELRLHAYESREAVDTTADDASHRRSIRVLIDGFRQFVAPGCTVDGASLLKAVEPFVSDTKETRHRLTNTARFLGSDSVTKFDLPEGTAITLVTDDVLRLSIAGYSCEIMATEPAPTFDDERPWIRSNHERNAPMSFVGALSSAAAWLEDNQAWEAKKATYPDGGKRLDELSREYARFLHENDPTHHDGIAREMHRSFAIAIADKNADYLIGWIARARGQNELSKKYFTKATGIKLPATIRDITAVLYTWSGLTPEQAADHEREKAEKRDARNSARRIDDDIKWCGNALSNTRVNHNGEIKTTKQFLDEIMAKGFTEIRKYKAGAVDRYSLANPDEQRSYGIKGKMVTYAKAVLAKAAEQKEKSIELEVTVENAQPTLRP